LYFPGFSGEVHTSSARQADPGGYPLNNTKSRALMHVHLRFFAFFSRSRRSAVRFLAAAVAAIFARAERSSGVIVSRLRLPPLEPIAAIACRRRARVSLAISTLSLSA